MITEEQMIDVYNINKEAEIKKQIVFAGFKWVKDPFLGYGYESIETFMKEPYYTSGYFGELGKPYETFKYFIIFNPDKKMIFYLPSRERENFVTFEDIQKFMKEMSKLENAL